jgi:single-strand DNA-binding protein
MLQNKVILTGNVGGDPEVKHLEGGNCVANLSLAISEKYKDKKGVKQEHTEWVKLVFWNTNAKLIEQYVKKGNKLQIEGKLRTRSWEKDGQVHYATEILVETFLFLSPMPAGTAQAYQAPVTNQPVSTNAASDFPPQNEELRDLPF